MHTLPHRTQIFTLSIATVALLLASNLATADIYKWRNNRGVIQYSDKPPVSGFTKASQHEIVNSLQLKDMCAEPTAKTAAAAARKISANFFGGMGSAGNILGFNRNTTSSSNISTLFNSPTRPVNVITVPRPVPAAPATVIPTPKPVVTTPAIPNPVVTTPKPTNVATAPTTTLPTPATPPPASSTQNIIQSLLMPAVDINKNVIPASGYSSLRIQPSSQSLGSTPGEGAFRIGCAVSHMSNDDPIVYPNQKGAAHHHTFFGNTSVNYASDVNNMASTGNSTCSGGIANRSAYWMPSMIDTTTNTPISNIEVAFYYKTGYGLVPIKSIVPPPKGLRMIAGNSKATSADTSKAGYQCIPRAGNTTAWTKNIQNCNVGDKLQMSISFPQCWDGKNLDSPDHISHMAYAGTNGIAGCPKTHPVALPAVTFNANFFITKANEALNWRLASDNYAKSLPGGYSGHADWVNGWDEKVMAGVVKNCLNAGRDCHSFLLGDGTTLY